MKHIYTRRQHRFFDDLVTMLISLKSFALGADIYRLGHGQNISVKGDSVSFGGLTIPVDLKFYPGTPFKLLSMNKWPSKIVLHEKALGSGMPQKVGTVLKSKQVKTVTSLLTQGAFIRYFETNRLIVEARYGKKTKHWPAIWNFGRAIRNAFAHGGEIHFFPHEPAVSWRGLTYSVSDNGKPIFHVDIAYVEVIYLMEEMDASI